MVAIMCRLGFSRFSIAGLIASAGFPAPRTLAWLAIVVELALVVGFLTGAYFSQASLIAAACVVFLAFALHGPSHWSARLLFAAAHGPGRVLALRT